MNILKGITIIHHRNDDKTKIFLAPTNKEISIENVVGEVIL